MQTLALHIFVAPVGSKMCRDCSDACSSASSRLAPVPAPKSPAVPTCARICHTSLGLALKAGGRCTILNVGVPSLYCLSGVEGREGKHNTRTS